MKSFYCFACKQTRPKADLKKSGTSKSTGWRWNLCVYCSSSYAEKQASRSYEEKKHKIGLCPSCESPERHVDGEYPLLTMTCMDCGFVFTIGVQPSKILSSG